MANTPKKTSVKQTPEERLTGSIIRLIENNQTEGSIDWIKVGLHDQHNVDGNGYNATNNLILSEEAQRCGYKNTQWLTYNQSKKLGGELKGQKSTYIVLSFPVFEKDKSSGKFIFDKNGKKIIKFFKKSGMPVFNIEQTGLEVDPKLNINETVLDKTELSEATEDFIKKFPVNIDWNGDRAYYSPGMNFIGMPGRDQFKNESSLFSVLAHECSHSTGHKDWLDREGITGTHAFGSKAYAKEELVAELSAAMICSKVGVEYKLEHHASYLKSWLEVLNNDSKFIFKAMHDATKASDEVLKYARSEDVALTVDPLAEFEKINKKVEEVWSETTPDNIKETSRKIGISEDELLKHLLLISPMRAADVFGKKPFDDLMNVETLIEKLEDISDQKQNDFIDMTIQYLKEVPSSSKTQIVKKTIASGLYGLLVNAGEGAAASHPNLNTTPDQLKALNADPVRTSSLSH